MSVISTLTNPIQTAGMVANALLENVPCHPSVAVGEVVRATALGEVVQADASSILTAAVLGVVETKSDATTCNVRLSGLSAPVFSGLDVTKVYFLSDSTPGALTTSAPSSSGSVVVRIGQPFSSSALIVGVGSPIVRV